MLAKFTIGAAVTFMLTALLISMPALSGSVSVLSGNEETTETAPTPAAAPEATPAGVQTTITEGEQTVTFPSNSNANATVSNSTAPAANSNRAVAVPVQPNPPSNQ